MHEPLITVVGHVAGPPRSRTTPTGVTVADFRIATTPRRLDRATGAWSDGETLWFGVTTWRVLAQHCVAALKKGDRVVVTGRLTTRSWQVEGGERRSNLEVEATSVGLDLSKAPAAYQRPPVLAAGEDPWLSRGLVDPATGELRADEHDPAHEAAGALAPREPEGDLDPVDLAGPDLVEPTDEHAFEQGLQPV